MAEATSPRPQQSMDDPPRLASVLSEDHLRCSICLDVFTEPVTTPCGHNFCKTCLTQSLEKSQHCQCPLCKEKFTSTPELKNNTTLKESADHFKKKSQADNPEVLYNVFTGEKQKALKSCLECGTSFCKSHPEPRYSAANQKLVDPVKNLEDYICQEHEKPLEMFCRDDQKCVCQLCTQEDHKHHNIIPVEEENARRKTKVTQTQAEVQQMIQVRLQKIQEFRRSVEFSKTSSEKEKAASIEVFTALIQSITKCQAELLETMEKKQKATERQAERFIKEMEQEIVKLKRRAAELEQLTNTVENQRPLQDHPSVTSPRLLEKWVDVRIATHLDVWSFRAALSELQNTLNEKLTESVNKPFKETVSRELKRIQQYAVDVTLDPDTSHLNLVLSEDGKQVTYGNAIQNLPDNPKRFESGLVVLGKQGFSSGRFYYEVQILNKTTWDLGVVRESVNRDGKVTLKPRDGFWTLSLRNRNVLIPSTGPPFPPSMREMPQKVGVFVDFEEGLASFYDVGNTSHIYSFTGQSFDKKLYPYFSPGNSDGGKNSAPIIISPVLKPE